MDKHDFEDRLQSAFAMIQNVSGRLIMVALKGSASDDLLEEMAFLLDSAGEKLRRMKSGSKNVRNDSRTTKGEDT